MIKTSSVLQDADFIGAALNTSVFTLVKQFVGMRSHLVLSAHSGMSATCLMVCAD